MKVVLLVTWLFGYGAQMPPPYQVEFDSIDLCNAAVETIRADVARLEQERVAEIQAAQKKSKSAEIAQMLAGRRYTVSAVCLVTKNGP